MPWTSWASPMASPTSRSDYPYTGDQELDAFFESIAAIPDIQQAFLDSPPAMSLALDWVEQQPWFDADRVELVGASLGVPFTAAAGALDKRFSRVWLLHGGADNVPWVMHAGRKYIENEFLRGIVGRGALLLVYGNSFRTLDWIPEIRAAATHGRHGQGRRLRTTRGTGTVRRGRGERVRGTHLDRGPAYTAHAP